MARFAENVFGAGHVRFYVGLVLAAVVAGSGCARTTDVVLHQTFAPPSQQHLKLVSPAGYFATDGAARTCVIEFPLPGAQQGPRAFVLYLRVPGDVGEYDVSAESSSAVRGFLVQEIGQLAGRTDLSAGTVRCRDVWLAPRRRTLGLAVECADGTVIEGTARLRLAPEAVRAFERAYRTDVQHAAATSPAERADRTDVREAAGGGGG